MKVFIDTETTGLDDDAEILQLSICDEKSNFIFNEYFKPLNHTEWPSAQKINNISPDDVKNCRSFREAAPEISQFLSSMVSEIHGYNVAFDMEKLFQNGLILKNSVKIIDECQICRQLYPSQKHSLMNMINFLKINVNPIFHKADQDTLALVALYNHFKLALPEHVFKILISNCSVIFHPVLQNQFVKKSLVAHVD